MHNKYSKWLGVGVLTVLISLASVSVVHADQGFYVVDKSARSGMLVSLSKNPKVVDLATTSNASVLVGILGGSTSSFAAEPGQLNVRTEGATDTLVTTVSGDIKVGDPITASSLVGLGSKLVGNGWIVGIAQGSLDASSPGAVKSTVSDSNGVKHDVYVGSVPVLVKVTYYTSQTSYESGKSIVPEKLQATIDSVAGRHASQTAILMASLLLLSGFFIAGFIVNAAVRNAIKSTARQPLAKTEIMRRMIQSCAISLGILVAAIVSALIVIRIL